MVKDYSIETNEFGYLLTNNIDNNDKVVLYKTKKSNAIASYYCKQVEPFELYYSGMFFDKKQNKYLGRTIDGKRINIFIRGLTAVLTIK